MPVPQESNNYFRACLICHSGTPQLVRVIGVISGRENRFFSERPVLSQGTLRKLVTVKYSNQAKQRKQMPSLPAIFSCVSGLL